MNIEAFRQIFMGFHQVFFLLTRFLPILSKTKHINQMKKLFIVCTLFLVYFTAAAQTEQEGVITALSMQSLSIKLNSSQGSLKGKNVEIIKKFNLSETFPKMKGEGTMPLGKGVVQSHQGRNVVIKITEYYSTKTENGVKKPLANITVQL